ncbi:hypothetical protein Rleg5DRAFT_2783 [Rhizobium leguminosarum bv. viciae WSM1455]|nr:hypothetical protein Rleg5DRAFT_2783 [Rhizobium leguminosarum bv. viciae WSM1455]
MLRGELRSGRSSLLMPGSGPLGGNRTESKEFNHRLPPRIVFDHASGIWGIAVDTAGVAGASIMASMLYPSGSRTKQA